MYKVFVDLNVILDILDAVRPRHALAKKALGQALEREDVLMMSMDMMTNFFYICHKKFDCHQMQKYMTFIQETFVLCDFTHQTLDLAMSEYSALCQKENRHADFEDLLQLACAKAQGCDYFLTEDKAIATSAKGVKVLSLAEFSKRHVHS
jgi:predicted nucleic acid-binding protein